MLTDDDEVAECDDSDDELTAAARAALYVATECLNSFVSFRLIARKCLRMVENAVARSVAVPL